METLVKYRTLGKPLGKPLRHVSLLAIVDQRLTMLPWRVFQNKQSANSSAVIVYRVFILDTQQSIFLIHVFLLLDMTMMKPQFLI
jgi:hypothetical protein